MSAEALKKKPEYKEAIEAFQKAKPEKLYETYEKILGKAETEQQRGIVNTAFLNYIKTPEGKKKINAALDAQEGKEMLGHEEEIKGINEKFGNNRNKVNATLGNQLFQSMVCNELSTFLALAGALKGEVINLANSYSGSLEKFINGVAVYDFEISNALKKSDAQKATALLNKRNAFISEGMVELAEQQKELTSKLKEGLTNYIKEFHERDISLAQAEIAATALPLLVAARTTVRGAKIGGEAIFKIGGKAISKYMGHILKDAFKDATKTGGILLTKEEMRKGAKDFAKEIIHKATEVDKTLADVAKELIPIYGPKETIEHLRRAQEKAGERADKIISLFFSQTNPQMIAFKGGH